MRLSLWVSDSFLRSNFLVRALGSIGLRVLELVFVEAFKSFRCLRFAPPLGRVSVDLSAIGPGAKGRLPRHTEAKHTAAIECMYSPKQLSVSFALSATTGEGIQDKMT